MVVGRQMIVWQDLMTVPLAPKGFAVVLVIEGVKTVDSCVGVKPPDIAGSWVGVENADDNESVCGVDTDSDDTVVSILAEVEVVVEAEDVSMIAVRVVVGELALWMASKKPTGHCNFCARWRRSTSAGIADSWLMDAEDMSGKWPEREARLR